MSIKDKLKKCLKEGEIRGERHKGLRKAEVKEEDIKGHLDKAIHNFKAMVDFHDSGYSDWSASAAFYCLYHCLLALIVKEGYESRNQSCTFALVSDMIYRKVTSLTNEELKQIFDSDVTSDLEHSKKILDIRERMQYSVGTAMTDYEFLELKTRTKALFDKLRRDIES